MSFKDRLQAEQSELSEKTGKLEIFLLSEKADEIDPEQKGLLFGQLQVMKSYVDILEQRMELLATKNQNP